MRKADTYLLALNLIFLLRKLQQSKVQREDPRIPLFDSGNVEWGEMDSENNFVNLC